MRRLLCAFLPILLQQIPASGIRINILEIHEKQENKLLKYSENKYNKKI
jgi:hypothetical protein